MKKNFNSRVNALDYIVESYGRRFRSLESGSTFTYIKLHLVADEFALLQEVSMKPEECKLVDLYWAYRNAVFFVTIYYSEELESGVEYKGYYPSASRLKGNFHVRAKTCPIYKKNVENALKYLSIWIDENMKFISSRASKDIETEITKDDIL